MPKTAQPRHWPVPEMGDNPQPAYTYIATHYPVIEYSFTYPDDPSDDRTFYAYTCIHCAHRRAGVHWAIAVHDQQRNHDRVIAHQRKEEDRDIWEGED